MRKSSFEIKPELKRNLQNASHSRIQSYFIELPEHEKSIKWLDKDNRYRVNCTSNFEKDVKFIRTNGRSFSSNKHKHLYSYIAASSPTHAIDGWSFLGRAIESTLRGDIYSAIHFAYYAELRAAMSILASEGIGIFNKKHAITAEINSNYFPQSNAHAPTHSVIWPVFRYWSSLSRAAKLLDDIIKPEGINLSRWFISPILTSGPKMPRTILSISAIAQRWLSLWGIDLTTVSEDHENRNLVSYRPSQFRKPYDQEPNYIIDFIEQLWKLFEPGDYQRFPNLEKNLLRSALRKYNSTLPTINDLMRLGFSSTLAKEWVDFLNSNDESLPLKLADQRPEIEEPNCNLSIISRAALLLFVATSSAQRILRNAGYNQSTISFWWTKFGIERSLWKNSNEPINPLDSWRDISDALTTINDWRELISNKKLSLRDLRENEKTVQALNELGSFEHICIWGLTP